jgi:hypothetical protein
MKTHELAIVIDGKTAFITVDIELRGKSIHYHRCECDDLDFILENAGLIRTIMDNKIREIYSVKAQ